MKKLIALLTASLLLTPAFALAQAPAGINASLRAEVKAERASSTNRGPGNLGQNIKNLASTTRAEWKGAASTTREATKERLQTLKRLAAEAREEFKQYAEGVKQRIQGRFGERVEKLATAIPGRLASTSARLTNIADRIEGRIEALETGDKDLTESASLLKSARTSIALADEKIFALSALFDTASSTTAIKARMADIRIGVKTTEDALKLAKEDLQKTLRSIKVETGATASTTSSI